MKKLIEKINEMNEAGKFVLFSGSAVRVAEKNNDRELLKAMIESGRCDYSHCPICGDIFCNIAWTLTNCDSCYLNSQELYDDEYTEYEKIKKQYKGTRLYGAFRRAGLSIKRAKKLGF